MATQIPLFVDSSTGDLSRILTGDYVDPTRLGSGAAITTKFLRGDNTWQTIAGGSSQQQVVNARLKSSANVVVTSAPATLDGVTLVSGDVILLADQTVPSQNGLWDFASAGAALTRNTQMASASIAIPGLIVTVSEGSLGSSSMWMLISIGTLTVGTSDLEFGTSGPTFFEVTVPWAAKKYVKYTFTVPGLYPGDRLDANVSGYTSSGIEFDELEFESVQYAARCDSYGVMTLIGQADTVIVGQRIVQITVRN